MVIKPFDSLSATQIKTEHEKRRIYTHFTTKKELAPLLQETLEGIQRVPSLLITNPTQNLEELNMQQYQVLECEPLHDIKGHICNILSELPSLLDSNTKQLFTQILATDLSKDKKT